MVHIAIDIGASSGCVVAGELHQGQLKIREIHRFSNEFTDQNGTVYWDVDHLLNELLVGLQKVKYSEHETCTVGIDTWAVDYVLLDQDDKRMKEVVSYRDKRTEKTMDKLTKLISKEAVYDKTGIQFLPFNTLFQLYEENREVLQKTKQILLIPDYLNYRLTGKIRMETTNASTTQLLNVKKRDLDEDLLREIGLSKEQFAPFVEPGNKLGMIKNEWFKTFDLPKCQVINIASHDTASAVVGTPSTVDHWAYLSSGTWSLLGIETDKPITTRLALNDNYTNEWGVFHTYRFLKNIMGMWIIQEVKSNLAQAHDYHELVQAAQKIEPFQQYIDFNKERFLNPENMIAEMQSYCKETDQPIPQTAGELAAAVYNNLAILYAIAIEEMEEITKERIERLYIVGGGGRNELLNQLTANLSNKPVFIGPTEATAIGNIVMQLIATGKINSLVEGRQLVADSFSLKKIMPQKMNRAQVIEAFNKITKE